MTHTTVQEVAEHDGPVLDHGGFVGLVTTGEILKLDRAEGFTA